MSRYQTKTYSKEESKGFGNGEPKNYSKGGVNPKDLKDPNLHKVTPTKEPIYHSSLNQTISNVDSFEPAIAPMMDIISVQTVRPVIASRSVIINRTVADPFNRGNRNYQSERVHRVSNMGVSVQPGTFSNTASSGVESVVESRGKEKKDMQDLNERLANYLEKVRFLEAQNRNLANELEKLKEKWGKETSQVKAMYQAELDEARKVLDEAVKDKGKLEIKVASLEDVIDELREKLDDARSAAQQWKNKWEGDIQKVSDAEAETIATKRMMEGMGMERERERKSMAKLQEMLANTRMDLDHETYRHLEAASKLQTLEEELAFLKSVHEEEMEEMSTLVNKDTTVDNRQFWKNEMGSALREIQELYDEKLEEVKLQCETTYATKVQEFKTGASRNNMEVGHSKEENKRLKSTLIDLRNRLSQLEGQNLNLKRDVDSVRRDGEEKERDLEMEKNALRGDIVKMRSEMEAIMTELQHLMDSKMGLELEICAYRKMLEGEEHRVDDLESHLKKAKAAGIKNYDYTTTTGNQGNKMEGDQGGNYGYRDEGKGGDEQGYKGAEKDQNGGGKPYSVFRNQPSKDAPSFQRTSKSPCVISEASEDGRCMAVENTGRREESLGNWSLKRFVREQETASYSFASDFALKPNTQVKIWAKGYRPRSSLNDLEMTSSTWGRGQEVNAKLLGPNGEEKATLVQTMTK